MKENLLDKMEDLLKQATTEHSHFYVASVLREAIDVIKKKNNVNKIKYSFGFCNLCNCEVDTRELKKFSLYGFSRIKVKKINICKSCALLIFKDMMEMKDDVEIYER